MKYVSVFEIIGPVMIGPSSSHTAGAVKIGRLARQLFGRLPKEALITLYGSFAKTYKGHGTDIALVGGILDFDTYDRRIVDSLVIAKDLGVNIQLTTSDEEERHPNTARITLKDEKGSIEIVGISVGGGKIELVELNGFSFNLAGTNPALFIIHEDRHGIVAKVAGVLAKHEINISHMELSRKGKGKDALLVIETDEKITDNICDEIKNLAIGNYIFKIYP